MKFATKPIQHYPPHLRHVATLPWKIKIKIFGKIWKKTQTNCILIASNFVIHRQILIFSVLICGVTDEKVFSVASPNSRQNDSIYAHSDTRKCSIAVERLLHYRRTFRKSLMVSVAVSKLGCSPLFFTEPGVKVDSMVVITGTCY